MPHYVLDARTTTPHFPGIGRYVTNLARALIPHLQSGERITLLHNPQYPASLPSSDTVQLLPVAASPFSLSQQWLVPGLLRRLNADIYHSTYYLMPYSPRVPTVLTVYDLIPLLLPEASSRRAALLFRATLTLALRAAQQVVTLSGAARDDLIRVTSSLPSVMTIPAAADPIFTLQTPDAIAAVRARYHLPERFVLYLGSNKPHKNLVRLVEAWHQFRAASLVTEDDMELVIAGAWDPRYPEARERASALGLSDIHWLGPIPGADLPALYAAATAFVFPSLYEGFGLPPLEAMACGTPVACSNASSLPEVLGGAALLFDPSSVTAIADALRGLLGNAELRSDLQMRGLRQAAQFSWTRTAVATLGVYRDLAASSP